MRIRRCAVLWLEPRETARFELASLLSGGTGIVGGTEWYAHAPQLASPLRIDADVAVALGALGAHDWCDDAALRAQCGNAGLRRLLRAGLVVGRNKAWAAQRQADDNVRAQHWHGLAATWHAASRWHGVDAAGGVVEAGVDTAPGLRARQGPPPPALHDRPGTGPRIALPRAARTPLDEVLDARATCRNFDLAAMLPQARFAQVLERVFGQRGQVHAADDFDVIKRTSPSGGALHPTEAYLLVRRVEGVAPGLYHYRPGDHALQSLAFDAGAVLADAANRPAMAGKDALDHLAWLAVGGQQWFAEAHALVVLAPRFVRNFWKYRNHPKAYRVAILDVGHLSQTLLLTATELGLGSFVTAAINEVDIERAFGLTHYVDGPLAVCGFGPRAQAMVTAELDPNGKAWPRAADQGPGGGTTRPRRSKAGGPA